MMVRCFITLLLFASLLVGGTGAYVLESLPNPQTDHQGRLTRLYDRDFEFLGYANSSAALVTTREEWPAHVLHALLVTEDRSFFDHYGFHAPSMIRALVVNLTQGRKVQGASTLTQQLARLVYLNQHKTYLRKAQELVLALFLETQLSKHQILEAYLNHAYFGAGAYGLASAAQRYFSKNVSELAPDEAALLFGLLKAPSALAPHRHPHKALARRNLILRKMGPSFQKWLQRPLRLRMSKVAQELGYMSSRIHRELGDTLRVNQKILTTLDRPLMRRVANLKRQLPIGQNLQLAAVVLSPDGEIRALQGGSDYHGSPYNRVEYLRRPAGKVMWPLTVTSALAQGWEMKNSVAGQESFWAPSLQKTLQDENLQGMAILGTRLNRARMKRTHRTLGLSGRDVQLAIGQAQVSPLQVASAYSALLHQGVRCKPKVLEASECFSYIPWAPQSVKKARGILQSYYPQSEMIEVAKDRKDAWYVSWKDHHMLVIWVGSEYGRHVIASQTAGVKKLLLKMAKSLRNNPLQQTYAMKHL